MTFPHNFETKIGFDKIRLLLEALCSSPLGREEVAEMSFSAHHPTLQQQLHQTLEMSRVEQNNNDLPIGNFYDVREGIKRIRVEGTFLDEHELFELKRSLESTHAIVSFLTPEPGETPPYPHLYALSAEVVHLPQLIRGIDAIIDKFGRMKENASPELQRIKRDINHTQASISRSLSSILREAQNEGYVEKETTPTLRDGRLLIPVTPSYKRKIKGIVHDESASGKTVFIEPEQVVEANNRVRELEYQERREVIRILTAFANTLRPHSEEIEGNYRFMAKIDFIHAKALFSLETEAEVPHISDTQEIEWYHAIHPLLMLSLKKQGKTVVPLDITLNAENRLLIISGPNAGGKSVCLKTVGLLQYMVQCGMPVPMYGNSHIGIFEDIFIDIGDEQSIENDLSTYSSHLTHMKHFVRHCHTRSLLLIDEFGGGTEPLIGGAIAEALLDRFNRQGAFGVITTHYHNLKHFAEVTPGIVNGAMLYDRHLMRPLFALSIGNPGSSFAIEIARKIGLPQEVIDDASSKVGSDYIDMDKYLQDIVRDKRYWENKRQQIRQREKRMEEVTEKYEKELSDWQQQRKRLIKEANAEALRIVQEANAKIENTIRSIKEVDAEKEKTKQIRQSLADYKRELSTESEIAKRPQKEKKTLPKKENTPFTLAPGDAVRLKGQTAVGEVAEILEKKAVITFGAVKSTIGLDRLEKVNRNLLNKTERKTTFISADTSEEMRHKRLSFRHDIDVRGMRTEEAIQSVTYFIDDAIQVGAGKVRILHGTGTGILRQFIRRYLDTVAAVSQYKDEHIQFGGAGITVVEFSN